MATPEEKQDRNWLEIANEYITTDISVERLANKHDIPYHTVRRRMERERWLPQRKELKRTLADKMAKKTVETLVGAESERLTRLDTIVDRLMDKIEEATEQLDLYIITNKVKTKTVEYEKSGKEAGKVAKEITTEEEVKDFSSGIVDRLGLKQVTSSLKDIKDIISSGSSKDTNEDDIANNLIEMIGERK